jgi:hypothetical protein
MDRNLTMVVSVTLMLSISTALPAVDPESRKVGNVTPGSAEAMILQPSTWGDLGTVDVSPLKTAFTSEGYRFPTGQWTLIQSQLSGSGRAATGCSRLGRLFRQVYKRGWDQTVKRNLKLPVVLGVVFILALACALGWRLMSARWRVPPSTSHGGAAEPAGAGSAQGELPASALPLGADSLYLDRQTCKTTIHPVIPSAGIRTGYFFAFGHFVPRPYMVSAAGRYVVVNGIPVAMVTQPVAGTDPRERYKDPGQFVWPANWAGSKSEFNGHVIDKWWYLEQECGGEIGMEKLLDWIRKDSHVKSVLFNESGKLLSHVDIVYTDGDWVTLAMRPRAERAVLPISQDRASEMTKATIGNYEDILKGDAILYVTTSEGDTDGGGWIEVGGGRGAVARDSLRRVVAVLQSPDTSEAKLDALTGLMGNSRFIAKETLENLEVTDDLRNAITAE